MMAHLLSSTPAAAPALIAMWTLRRQSAALRYAILLAALLSMQAACWPVRERPDAADIGEHDRHP
jgi:hypothetical protein